MIPLQLKLKNFLSYRHATLDFRGLHTACICGANGAGKSSLLEAITWAVWGKSRAASDDDIINAAATSVRVDFEFQINQQVYRIIRSRSQGKSSKLEFQVLQESGHFLPITAKGLRSTEKKIIETIKLDYDTFVNSAYLRQGRADEFMLRRASERKQVLADLLKLDRYEVLANRAKDEAKQYKGKLELLEESLEPIKVKLAEKKIIEAQQKTIESDLQQLQTIQAKQKKRLRELQALDQQRKIWQQQLSREQLQYENSRQDCDRLRQDISKAEDKLAELKEILEQSKEIKHGYQYFSQLKAEEAELSVKFTTYQQLEAEKRNLEAELLQEKNQITEELTKVKSRLEALNEQEQELEPILRETDKVATGLEQLKFYRQQREALDSLQAEVAPLLQQQRDLQTELATERAKIASKLEQLVDKEKQLAKQISQIPQIRQKALEIYKKIQELDKKKVYLEHIRQKKEEKKRSRTGLDVNQQTSATQLRKIEEKLALLQTPHPACPLCEQTLDEHYRDRVIQKTQTEKQQIEEQIWLLKEQINKYERELNKLNQTYQEISQEIVNYDLLQQQSGQLETKLEATGKISQERKQIQEEIEVLRLYLTTENYAKELQAELANLQEKLRNLNYDEQNHALIRGQEKNWSWAEFKQIKIDEAKRRKNQIISQKPDLEKQIAKIETNLTTLETQSPLQKNLSRKIQEIQQLDYQPQQHQTIRDNLQRYQIWQLKYQQLELAQQQYPSLEAHLVELESELKQRTTQLEQRKAQLEELITQKDNIVDNTAEINQLEAAIQARRKELDQILAEQGKTAQNLEQIAELSKEYKEKKQEIKHFQHQYLIYQELSKAFGKNGIQAHMIENILPQLEEQANQILQRLTGNQLHVSFVTQKLGRSSSKKNSKLIDTLDITIGDATGTRSYETYSGGEAFRINFSIRLALASLLAQRSGTSLQMLIIDEGFGTQDSAGCERLIAAINAIAPDFNCILTVTHMPRFKEAFQTRIEITKTDSGSQLRVVN